MLCCNSELKCSKARVCRKEQRGYIRNKEMKDKDISTLVQRTQLDPETVIRLDKVLGDEEVDLEDIGEDIKN